MNDERAASLIGSGLLVFLRANRLGSILDGSSLDVVLSTFG
jgi:hypothetical protein